jgi:hypothetical protein
VFTESLLLQKGHFLSSKRGRSFKKYFFRSLMGHFSPEKRALFPQPLNREPDWKKVVTLSVYPQ